MLALLLAVLSAGDLALVAREGPKGAAGRAFVLAAIEANLADKRAQGLSLTADEITRTVVRFELFKFRTYVSSGVFPKRYFGYFDRKGDTAAREAELRDVVRAAVDEIDRYQRGRKKPVRVSCAEVAVTFIAEGGAILLRENQSALDAMDPVHDIGLDDIESGFAAHPELVRRLDARLHTSLASVVGGWEPTPLNLLRSVAGLRPLRPMTFREGLAATAVLYLYEKEIAAGRLWQRDRVELMSLPLDEQMVTASLVYNAGILFSRERVRQILTFRTGRYLDTLNESLGGKRRRLPVLPPLRARALLVDLRRYPEQPTSWSAVYHVLQRYGGYIALQRFGNVFDGDGQFR
jgi:hypothetical protein